MGADRQVSRTKDNAVSRHRKSHNQALSTRQFLAAATRHELARLGTSHKAKSKRFINYA